MDCTHCNEHQCRSFGDCSARRFDRNEALEAYGTEDVAQVVSAAAHLVDHGRAGTLNRLQEIAEYSLDRDLQHIGLAYCWGMEKDASLIASYLRTRGLRVSAVSCTTGGLAQDQVNPESEIHKVSCNPIGQSSQLNEEKVQLVVAVGLCLGHDMLLQKQSQAPVTTLVVKDRTSNHAPLTAIRQMVAAE